MWRTNSNFAVLDIYPRIFVFRRLTGHLRRDANLWTFLFFCEPFDGFKESNFVSDIPENSISDVKEWIPECIYAGSSQDHLENLERDGFGVVVKILRDIKSSWKLMLNEFENFLDEIVRTSSPTNRALVVG